MKVYLHQLLSRSGLFERKEDVFNAIRSGEVSVGGSVVTDPKYQFNPGKKKVSYRGKLIEPPSEKAYVVLNKPEGFLSSKLAPEDIRLGKKSMFELLAGVDEKIKRSLFSAGRLDEDTSGLIILTNDGKLGSKITKPGIVEKTYQVVLENPISRRQVAEIEGGVVIELEENGKTTKYKTKKCAIKLEDSTHLDITLTEGKKREVRRIFEAVGNKVRNIQRISIGRIRLSDLGLREGEYKFVDKQFLEERLENA
jgi:pseudouridine synthase